MFKPQGLTIATLKKKDRPWVPALVLFPCLYLLFRYGLDLFAFVGTLAERIHG
jgi:hypothetical protein